MIQSRRENQKTCSSVSVWATIAASLVAIMFVSCDRNVESKGAIERGIASAAKQVEGKPQVPKLDHQDVDDFATLDWISFNDNGWKIATEETKMRSWQDADGDLLILAVYSQPEVKTNGVPKGFPDLADGQDTYLEYERGLVERNGASIVEVGIRELADGVHGSYAITKKSQDPTGFEYSVATIIPRRDFSIWLLMVCPETGTTGIRDAVVCKELIKNGEVKVDFSQEGTVKGIVGFLKDPYDSEFDEGAKYNLSDQRKYDETYPKSPIARLRKKFDAVLESVEFSPKVSESLPYEGEQDSPSISK